MATKWVYLFSEGNANMRNLLGGKGANLAEMTNLGLPVPQGFTITTEACTQYYEDGRKINDEIMGQIMEYIGKMEEITGKKFGDKENPLLVSVRSGARASMPGMMDTILNLGLNEEVVEVLAKKSGNPRWAWDCYRRFIQMFSDVVMEVGKKYFEELIDKMKAEKGVKQDVELTAEDLHDLAEQFKAEYKEKIGKDFPTDPKEQLMEAIKAVFRSWDNPRANVYRRDNDIPYSWGTAVNVQMMAFGNMGETSGTGVAFTRDPATGEKHLMGEFLMNAQGEDVVAGVRTPQKIDQLKEVMPEVYEQFVGICHTLEDHYRDMQDMEFTIEDRKLYMLQTRNGKRTAKAALKIACDLVDEGMIDEKKAVKMIDPRNLDTLLHPQFDAAALKKAEPVAKALAASPGAACGKIVFTAEDAKTWKAKGEKVVLVRLETSPEDIEGIGITNQRETTIVWNRHTGVPVYNAIVWQCRRTAERIDQLKEDGLTDYVKETTGLIPDAYFSASKVAWILDHVEGARKQAENGDLAFGTIDTWLIWNLTRGEVHATDYTNASRTMMFDIHKLDWDQKILDYFKIPKNMLPKVKPSSGIFGYTEVGMFGESIPIAGAAGDQQSALFGQCCFDAGEVKNTYGTGCFLLMNTGEKAVTSENGLLTTIAASADGTVQYALEGSIFVAGAAIQWLRDEMRMIRKAADTERYATAVEDTAGVYLVPAFTGIGAPYWDPYARGTVVGITRGCKKEHFIRAALESMAYQTNDILKVMEEESGVQIRTLKVDGGASNNNFLMQFQADMLDKPVNRPSCVESTALGAAYLAGLAVGYWESKEEVMKNVQYDRVFIPSIDPEERAAKRKGWNKAVKYAFGWARQDEDDE